MRYRFGANSKWNCFNRHMNFPNIILVKQMIPRLFLFFAWFIWKRKWRWMPLDSQSQNCSSEAQTSRLIKEEGKMEFVILVEWFQPEFLGIFHFMAVIPWCPSFSGISKSEFRIHPLYELNLELHLRWGGWARGNTHTHIHTESIQFWNLLGSPIKLNIMSVYEMKNEECTCTWTYMCIITIIVKRGFWMNTHGATISGECEMLIYQGLETHLLKASLLCVLKRGWRMEPHSHPAI